jgi:hypothetical protein
MERKAEPLLKLSRTQDCDSSASLVVAAVSLFVSFVLGKEVVVFVEEKEAIK